VAEEEEEEEEEAKGDFFWRHILSE
jgi:hypothetical protein